MTLTLTNTETEVFAIGVQEAYQHADYFDTSWSMFTGQIAGESINVPVMETEDARQDIVDSVAHLGAATMTGNTVTLTEPIKSFADIKKTDVDIRPDLSLISNLGASLGRNVGLGRTKRIASFLAGTTETDGNFEVEGDFLPGVASLGAKVQVGIADIMALMDEAGNPSGMRFGLLAPFVFYALRGEAEVISSDFTQGQNRNQSIGGNMADLDYLNCTIRNMGGIFGQNFGTDTLFATEYRFNLVNVVGLFWHHDAWIVRHQTGLESSIDWLQREQVWMSIARLHMGIKIIQQEGLYVLLDDGV